MRQGLISGSIRPCGTLNLAVLMLGNLCTTNLEVSAGTNKGICNSCGVDVSASVSKRTRFSSRPHRRRQWKLEERAVRGLPWPTPSPIFMVKRASGIKVVPPQLSIYYFIASRLSTMTGHGVLQTIYIMFRAGARFPGGTPF